MAVRHSDTSQRLKPRKFKLSAAAGSRALSKRLYGTAEAVPFPDSPRPKRCASLANDSADFLADGFGLRE